MIPKCSNFIQGMTLGYPKDDMILGVKRLGLIFWTQAASSLSDTLLSLTWRPRPPKIFRNQRGCMYHNIPKNSIYIYCALYHVRAYATALLSSSDTTLNCCCDLHNYDETLKTCLKLVISSNRYTVTFRVDSKLRCEGAHPFAAL